MRLTNNEIDAIRRCLLDSFPGARIYLFGSRVDDNKKGGDIDLYIETHLKDTFQRKINFRTQLILLIGEQKIDVLINDGSEDKQIFIEAKKTGVEIVSKYQENLENIFSECGKHTIRIKKSSAAIAHILPLNIETYKNLDDNTITLIDQMLFRFAKLQDLIDNRLFNNVLLFLEEDIRSLSMIDKLNRLEQLEIIESRQSWQTLRDIRNSLAHEYEQNEEKSVKFINDIFSKREALINFYLKIEKFYQVIKNQ